jgi:serine/threonine-protein kinase RsbW
MTVNPRLTGRGETGANSMSETTTTAAPSLAWSRAFDGCPRQIREARRFVAGVLDGCAVADDAILCVSELAANAVVHSNSRQPGGRFNVRVAIRRGDCVRVEVQDQGGPWNRRACADGQHGRGLQIVGQLTREWGVSGDRDAGWTVWCEISCAHWPAGEARNDAAGQPARGTPRASRSG